MQGYVDERTYRQFLMDMRTASVKYHSSKEMNEKREAWSDMIVAISNLQRPLPDSDIGAIQTFIELQGALGDLNEGRTPEVLKPAVKSRQRDNVTYQMHLGAAAAIVDLLIADGLTQETALRKAVELLKKGGAELPTRHKNESSESEAFKRWRDRLGGKEGKQPRFSYAKESHQTIHTASKMLQTDYGFTKEEATKCIVREIWPTLMR